METSKEGKMRRIVILLAVLALAAPLVLAGCGSDGGTGATGATGPDGPPGTGVTAQETCNLCHGNTVDINAVHRLSASGVRLTAGTATVAITSVVFPAPTAEGYVKVQVNFTFQALDSGGTDITSSIDLRTLASGSTTNLRYMTFALAKLVPGLNGDSNEWSGFVADPGASGSSPFRTVKANGVGGAVFTGTPATGVYSYTFGDNVIRVSDGYEDNVVMRATVQASSFDVTLFTSDPILQLSANRAVANAYYDSVPPIGGGTGVVPSGAYPTRNDVTTAACNKCHDPLSIHGSRRETAYCVVCHNPKLETKPGTGYAGWDNSSLMNLVHGLHSMADIGELNPSTGGVKEFMTYPQNIRNCTTCHQGTDTFWKTRPTQYSCNSCHNVNFATGAGHGPSDVGGAWPNNSTCALCHSAEAIVSVHADPNLTVGNVPAGVDNIVYFIDSLTADNNVPVVGFHITKNGAAMDLSTWPPAGYVDTSGPTFLVSYAMAQDNITSPTDYNNLGKAAAQPASVTLKSLYASLTGTAAGYTARLTSAPFPAGSTLRAVALQAYFTQLVGAEEIGRHSPAVMRSIGTARRTVVSSDKCLECHGVLELHGGSRVNNVQVCVMCHNPNLSSSGRTAAPGTTVNTEGGTPPAGFNAADPLSWPERTNNMKELVHGIHGGEMRGATNPYTFVRLRSGTAYYFDWSEVTYPSQARNCMKCHNAGTYEAALPSTVLFTTEETTNGTNTQAGITAARSSLPNATDLVNSPAASACGFCHVDTTSRSHMALQGGKIKATRSEATAVPPALNLTSP
jgi:OmcA/MtrC family decaheme c-type cytochrome